MVYPNLYKNKKNSGDRLNICKLNKRVFIEKVTNLKCFLNAYFGAPFIYLKISFKSKVIQLKDLVIALYWDTFYLFFAVFIDLR